MNDKTIADAVHAHLNMWPDKPCNIALEAMEKAPIAYSMAMQQLSGTVVTRRYIDGSFIGEWPFAVYVRLSGTDTKKRLDAVRTLEALRSWLESEQPPDIGIDKTPDKFEMTGLPSIAGAYEDGGTDYQAIFKLNYKQRSE